MAATGKEISKDEALPVPDKRLAFMMSLLVLATVLAILKFDPLVFDRHRASLDIGAKKRADVVGAYSRLPIYFIPNRAQVDKRVKYYAVGPGYSFFLTGNEAAYSFVKSAPKGSLARGAPGNEAAARRKASGHTLKIKFFGANPNASVNGEKKQGTKVNYFRGRDAGKWRSDIPTFAQVSYKNIYKGIDLVYRGDQSKIKYEFRVAAGADYRRIRLVYSGADSLAVDKKGDLIIKTPLGKLKDERPYVYQVVNGKRLRVSGDFTVNGRTVSFLAGVYDPSYPLIIDPGLLYSTYVGGGSMDNGVDLLAVDSSGSAYITGYTSSVNYPTTVGAYDSTQNGGTDVFVSKLNSAGNGLVYSTFLGGSANDYGYGVALDADENAYVTGYTYSADFPTTAGAIDSTLAASPDAFIVKLNPSGSGLVYSTYFGGAGADYGRSLAVDASNNAYVTGYSDSADLSTTPGAYDTSFNGGTDAFVTKINSSGTTLLYSTFIGGGGNDSAYNLALNSAGNAFVTGNTFSGGWPATGGAFDTSYNGAGDAYVVKLNSAGSGLDYSTLLGGGGTDYGSGLTLDGADNVYVAGQTSSGNFPVTGGAFDASINGGYDAFVTKLNASGSSLGFSTFLGGTADDYAYGVSLDSSGSVYLTGMTFSTGFPTTADARAAARSGTVDAFVTKLMPNGSALAYSTFLGGSNNDYGYSLGVDSARNIYITGQTNSGDFPTTPGAFDGTNSGFDAFVTKMDIIRPTTSLSTTPAVNDGDGGWFRTTPMVALTVDESASTFYQWDSTTGPWLGYGGAVSALEGRHVINYFSIDAAANTETVAGREIWVDTGQPADPVLSSTNHTTGTPSNNNNIDIALAGATDAVSGVDGFSTMFSPNPLDIPDTVIDLVETDTTFSSGPLADGAWYAHLRTRDAAGNWTSTVHLGPFVIDTIMPTTSLSTTPSLPNGENGWYKSPVTAILTRSETGATNYQWDSSATLGWTSFVDLFRSVAALEGEHTLYFYSADGANTEPVSNQSYKQDTGAPTAPALSGIGASPTSIFLYWSPSADSASGPAGYRIFDADTDLELATATAVNYTISGLSPSTTYRYYVRSKDNAGNYSAASNVLTRSTSPPPVTGLNTFALLLGAYGGIGAGLFTLRRARRINNHD